MFKNRNRKGYSRRKLGFPGGERFDVLSHSATLTPGNTGNSPVTHQYPTRTSTFDDPR